jgi:hypothetical protein
MSTPARDSGDPTKLERLIPWLEILGGLLGGAFLGFFVHDDRLFPVLLILLMSYFLGFLWFFARDLSGP